MLVCTNNDVTLVSAEGCPDVDPPPNAWVDRTRDRAVVKCNYTQETWYMTCSGMSWSILPSQSLVAPTERLCGSHNELWWPEWGKGGCGGVQSLALMVRDNFRR